MHSAADLIEAIQDTGSFVHLSGTLKRTAVKLSKICNDLRLLSSGPRAGLHEIALPAVQAGSIDPSLAALPTDPGLLERRRHEATAGGYRLSSHHG